MIRSEFLRVALPLLCAVIVGGVVAADDKDPADLARRAIEAYQKGDGKKAIALAEQSVQLDPRRIESWLLRARLYSAQREHAMSLVDFTEAIRLDPKAPEGWQGRGESNFRAGRFAESVADFDEFLKRAPSERPHHWQRGISLYYAGRFKDGKEQFELHQTVNTNDVENAVWHFLCTARAEGLESARKKLIPISGDSRIPMAEVHRLFAGKATPKDVIAAAEAAPKVKRAGEPLFYAHLYLGIYHEAIGEPDPARSYILKAAERADQNGYMGDVARVHAELLKKKRQ